MHARSRDEGGLAEEFFLVGSALGKWLNHRLRETGTTHARMRLLHALQVAGRLRMSDLGDELGVTPRNVTALVDALEQEGYVRRSPHPHDRRATLVELTATGDDVCGAIMREHAAAVEELFGELSKRDRRDLSRILKSLREVLESKTAAPKGGSAPWTDATPDGVTLGAGAPRPRRRRRA